MSQVGLLVVLCALADPTPTAAHRPKVAVLDTHDVGGNLGPTAKLVSQVLAGEVAKVPQIEAISSEQIGQMLGFERQKQLLGCSEDGSCLAEIGGALGADYLLTSQLGKLGTRYRLDLQILDAKRAKTVASVGDFLPAEDDALANGVVTMLHAVLSAAKLPSGDTTASPPSKAAAAELTEKKDVQPVPSSPSHAAAWTLYGIGAALLVGAAMMTKETQLTYESSVSDFRAGRTNTTNQSNLGWMGPLTDGLWAGTVVAAGVGTFLYLSASSSPAGSGGEVGLVGHF